MRFGGCEVPDIHALDAEAQPEPHERKARPAGALEVSFVKTRCDRTFLTSLVVVVDGIG